MAPRKLIQPPFLYPITLAILCISVATARAQDKSDLPASDAASVRDSVRQMQLEIQQLQSLMRDMKEEADRYHAETLELKHELELTRQKLDSATAAGTVPTPPAVNDLVSPQVSQSPDKPAAGDSSGRLQHLEEDQELLRDKVDEQYQTKVESNSKLRVKLSGILLMNIFSDKGNVDHTEVPGIALATTPSLTGGNTGGSFGATFRQSEVGLEVYGPSFAGAKTEASFVADFFGEFPETNNGSVGGELRLRTGNVRLDWGRTSLTGGLDSLFFSPIYPTSFASLGIPALSYSGNLWSWTPQLVVAHDLMQSTDSRLTISGGILDPLTGEAPQNEFLRIPGAGESSRQPAYGARLEWRKKIMGQPLMLGLGGYYSRENWGFNRNINGWAATNDWIIPFGGHFSLSGEFYGGSAIGGLGAGIGRSVEWNGFLSDQTTTVTPIGSVGGWSQFKIKASQKLEFNLTAGQDSAVAGDVRGFTATSGYFASNLNQNRTEFVNFIYRPRASLLFSTEFRTLRTSAVDGVNSRANQLNLAMGVLF